MDPALQVFQEAFAEGDVDRATSAFAVDAVMHSPFAAGAYVGRAAIRLLLGHVRDTFDDFRYTDVIDGHDHLAAFVFAATVDGDHVEGIDLLRLDDRGMVAALTVMVRPKAGARSLERAVQARLTAIEQRPSPGEAWEQTDVVDREAHSTANPSLRKTVDVDGCAIAYLDVGAGHPVVFLHGNPTSSHLWRNVIPHVADLGRCLAPDLMGMGFSGNSPSGSYRFADHRRALDGWFADLALDRPATLVLHDWGSALGFDWARRHPDAVHGIVYMESIVRPVTWEEWPDPARHIFRELRSPAGETMILDKNLFVELLLPMGTLHGIADHDMAVYRGPYQDSRESRRPTLAWPREIPIDGEPADVAQVVADYGSWLESSSLPKLFINAEPGMILTGAQREYCRSWRNQTEITVTAGHYVQEDAPAEVGRAVAGFIRAI